MELSDEYFNISIEYFKFNKNRKTEETVYILCDCSQAIDIIVKRLCFAIRFEVFKRPALLESALSEMNVKIILAWIPGHQGIEFNEFTDFLAEEAARDIYTGRLSAPSFVTYNDVAKIAADITRKSWQKKWDQDVCGSYIIIIIKPRDYSGVMSKTSRTPYKKE